MWIPILKAEAKEFGKEVARSADFADDGEDSGGGPENPALA